MSDVTLHVNMTPLTVEDGLFDLLRIIASTAGFAKRLSGSDQRRSERTDSNIKSELQPRERSTSLIVNVEQNI